MDPFGPSPPQSIQSVSAMPIPTRYSFPTALNRTSHHERYYLQDGVIILVENTLFKVPRYMLMQESSFFADMFSMPSEEREEGKTDAAPIQLLQVKAVDFERLLEVLYPRRFSEFTAPTTRFWGEEEWTSILHLATRWQMHDVRSWAITRLTESASSLSKISLGRLYDYPPWIRAGFAELCLREALLDEEDASRLDLTDILGVAAAREKIRARAMEPRSKSTWEDTKYGACMAYETWYGKNARVRYLNHKMVHQILDDVFGLEETTNPLESRPNSPIGTP